MRMRKRKTSEQTATTTRSAKTRPTRQYKRKVATTSISKQETPTTNCKYAEFISSLPANEFSNEYREALKKYNLNHLTSKRVLVSGPKSVRINEGALSMFIAWLDEKQSKNPRNRTINAMFKLPATDILKLSRTFLVKVALTSK